MVRNGGDVGMEIKQAIKETNAALKDFLFHDHWELKEIKKFYEQAFRDFWYATKLLARWSICLVFIAFLPITYAIGVINRIRK